MDLFFKVFFEFATIIPLFYILFFFLAMRHVGYRESNGNPLQYSCLENRMDGGAW